MKLAQVDAKLIQSQQELELIESWFDGRSIKLERLYRATENGFTGAAYQSKCMNTEHIFNVVESEHGRKFGGYSSVKFDQTARWYADPNAFVFSLSNQVKLSLINKDSACSFH